MVTEMMASATPYSKRAMKLTAKKLSSWLQKDPIPNINVASVIKIIPSNITFLRPLDYIFYPIKGAVIRNATG